MTKIAPRTSAPSLFRQEIGVAVGWTTVIVFFALGGGWLANLGPLLPFAAMFAWLFATMLWLAFRAVHHAEAIAERVGEPVGTIVLTLSVICIEVALVTMVMLTGGGTPTLARDTMFAVVMVVLNGMVGGALLIGGLKHREQKYDLRGANAYLSVLVPLAVLGLILPRLTVSAPGGQVSMLTGAILAIISAGLYIVFLFVQTSVHEAYFHEPTRDDQLAQARLVQLAAKPPAAENAHAIEATAAVHTSHATLPTVMHFVLLLAALLPIVLLSKKLAVLVDFGVAKLNALAALGGLVVAALVLAPEGVAGFRAVLANQLQRTINLLFGAALSTIGLTIPAVLAVRLFSGRQVELGLAAPEALLLGLTLLVCVIHFSGRRTTVLQGAVHLMLFVAYLMLIFD